MLCNETAKEREIMRFCTECGAKNEDHSRFCCACGAALLSESSPNLEQAQSRSDSPPVTAASLSRDLERDYRAAFHIPNSETIVTTIGNSFVHNFLMNGTVQETVAVATNRRFYYQGRSLVGENRSKLKISRHMESGSVLVKDISYTGMVHRDKIWLKIVAIICTFYLITNTISGLNSVRHEYSRYGTSPVALLLLLFLGCIFGGLIVALFWFLYKRSKLNAFIISFPGGGLAIPIKYYSTEEIREFQEKLAHLIDTVKS